MHLVVKSCSMCAPILRLPERVLFIPLPQLLPQNRRQKPDAVILPAPRVLFVCATLLKFYPECAKDARGNSFANQNMLENFLGLIGCIVPARTKHLAQDTEGLPGTGYSRSHVDAHADEGSFATKC